MSRVISYRDLLDRMLEDLPIDNSYRLESVNNGMPCETLIKGLVLQMRSLKSGTPVLNYLIKYKILSGGYDVITPVIRSYGSVSIDFVKLLLTVSDIKVNLGNIIGYMYTLSDDYTDLFELLIPYDTGATFIGKYLQQTHYSLRDLNKRVAQLQHSSLPGEEFLSAFVSDHASDSPQQLAQGYATTLLPKFEALLNANKQ